MKFTTIKSKKLLVGLLSTAITFNCLGTYQSLAMITDEPGSAPTATDDASNRVMEILRTKVPDCLKDDFKRIFGDRSLSPEEYMKEIAEILTDWSRDGDNSFGHLSAEKKSALLDHSRTMLDLCVEHKVSLHVDPERFSGKWYFWDDEYLWDTGLCGIFESYMEANPGLFSRGFSTDQQYKIIDHYFWERHKIMYGYDTSGSLEVFGQYLKEHPELCTRKLSDADLEAIYSYMDTHPELLTRKDK